MSFARRDWFSESARLLEREAQGKSARHGGGCCSSSSGAGRAGAATVSSGCLGAAKTVALMPVKAGSVAANQARFFRSKWRSVCLLLFISCGFVCLCFRGNLLFFSVGRKGLIDWRCTALEGVFVTDCFTFALVFVLPPSVCVFGALLW